MVRLTPPRLLLALLLCALFLFSPKLLRRRRGYQPFFDRPLSTTPVSYGGECSPFTDGGLDNVVVVLKMTSSQVATELPAYLSRIGHCLTKDRMLLFSDRAERHDDLHVFDALQHLRPEYKYHNRDFEIYDQIQRAEAAVESEPLDKYKLLPMMELTWKHHPHKDWFIFLELDTYVNWDNLHRFLSHFDPSVPHYFGSPVRPRKKPVTAYGSSGIIISRAALNKIMSRGRMFAENHHAAGTHLFGIDMTKECCGDQVLAKVLKQSGVPLRGYWPMFNGESPSTLRFGGEQWCEAVLTLHFGDAANLHEWESAREQPSQPLTFKELFTYIEPLFQERIDDWTNMSDDKIRSAKSLEACRAACIRDSKCIQYEHAAETCRLSHVARLGHAQRPEDAVRWTSGWIVDRIPKFKNAQPLCKGAHFVHANP